MNSVNVVRKYAVRRMVSGLLAMGEKRRLLERYGWYKTMSGNWTDSHAFDFMTMLEVARCTPEELEYKFKHGSKAVM